jgi:RIO-like serine/threonine protein kinase
MIFISGSVMDSLPHSHRSGVLVQIDRDAAIERTIQLQDKRQYETKLTHGDFNSLNILVEDDNIVGIIDWEMAGWYPDYWESTSAWHVYHMDEYWRPEVEKILDADYYAEELEAEKIRRRYFQSA